MAQWLNDSMPQWLTSTYLIVLVLRCVKLVEDIICVHRHLQVGELWEIQSMNVYCVWITVSYRKHTSPSSKQIKNRNLSIMGKGTVFKPLAQRILIQSLTVLTRKEMFYLTMHSTHFIYGYMASDIWLRTIRIVRKETRCRHIGYSFRLTARALLYPSYRQDSTYQGLGWNEK